MYMDTKVLREQILLMSSLFKWTFFAVMAGAVVGTAAAGFLVALDMAIGYVSSFSAWRYLLIFLPFCSALFYPYVCP